MKVSVRIIQCDAVERDGKDLYTEYRRGGYVHSFTDCRAYISFFVVSVVINEC